MSSQFGFLADSTFADKIDALNGKLDTVNSKLESVVKDSTFASAMLDRVSAVTFSQKMDTLNRFMAALVTANGGSLKPESWSEVQALVRAGLHSRVFAIGDQLTCMKGGENGTALVWDVIGIDHDTPADPQFTHSLTLQLHDVYKDLTWETREAFFYCASALPAGTYNFKVGVHPFNTAENAAKKNYQFTTTVEVPAGGQLVFKQSRQATLEGGGIDTFASAEATTPLETVTMTEGTSTSGTSLGTIDETKHDGLNAIARAFSGNNNYKESEIRQYLNSDKAAGSVWTAQNVWDRPPAWASTENGWMYDLDPVFLAVIGEVTKKTARNTVCDGGGYDTTTERFFLLAQEEVYTGRAGSVGGVGGVDEGGAYRFYSDYSELAAAGSGADANRTKYMNGTKKGWWLRTPFVSSTHNKRMVKEDGGIDISFSTSINGVAPACCII